ncbi:MAG: signal recognition particle-docking protein FtsY [Clostridia bacterium]|nr:signal recognition particle-docking protein FtsY [Clostridia bacterium]
MGFFDKLKNGLGKTRDSLSDKMNNVFSTFRKVDEELLEELEEILIMSDIGVDTSVEIIGALRDRIKKEKISDEEGVKTALKEEMQKVLDETENDLDLSKKPTVILVVGVNGVGKTTSIGKIANRIKKEGKEVIIAAADTFRAAAVEQVEIWAKRSNSKIVKQDEGTDPASVVYEAIQELKKVNGDVLICDTAGRLHNKKYLMDELLKIKKVIDKELPDAKKEVLLVLDATTGQNAISQVKAFKETVDITGLVLTKLDGTAKGGVVIGIVSENKIPVKFIGVGEQIDDMEIFNSKDFVDAII